MIARQTRRRIVARYRQLRTQHLRGRRERLNAKQAMAIVIREFGYSRAQIYRLLPKDLKR